MTFVVARRRDDIAWLIADTYAEIPALNKTIHPFETPTPKVVRIREFAVAYAGSVDQALAAIHSALAAGGDPTDALLHHHCQHLNSPASVDFVVMNTTTF